MGNGWGLFPPPPWEWFRRPPREAPRREVAAAPPRQPPITIEVRPRIEVGLGRGEAAQQAITFANIAQMEARSAAAEARRQATFEQQIRMQAERAALAAEDRARRAERRQDEAAAATALREAREALLRAQEATSRKAEFDRILGQAELKLRGAQDDLRRAQEELRKERGRPEVAPPVAPPVVPTPTVLTPTAPLLPKVAPPLELQPALGSLMGAESRVKGATGGLSNLLRTAASTNARLSRSLDGLAQMQPGAPGTAVIRENIRSEVSGLSVSIEQINSQVAQVRSALVTLSSAMSAVKRFGGQVPTGVQDLPSITNSFLGLVSRDLSTYGSTIARANRALGARIPEMAVPKVELAPKVTIVPTGPTLSQLTSQEANLRSELRGLMSRVNLQAETVSRLKGQILETSDIPQKKLLQAQLAEAQAAKLVVSTEHFTKNQALRELIAAKARLGG